MGLFSKGGVDENAAKIKKAEKAHLAAYNARRDQNKKRKPMTKNDWIIIGSVIGGALLLVISFIVYASYYGR